MLECAMVKDPRTLQANERTLLAWLRTGASLITLGFAIAKLGQWLRESGHNKGTSVAEIIGGAFVFLGAISEFMALERYHRIRKALLADADVPIAGGSRLRHRRDRRHHRPGAGLLRLHSPVPGPLVLAARSV